jgi:DNA polymerase-1
MAHQKPNTANIPSELKEDGSPKLLGREMRSLWQAPRNRLLVGVDAEGIQLRIFAHYIDDPEFTKALVEGKKHDKTDPHSLNQRILGDICKSRQAAKRSIYALLLGAGMEKLSQVLECSKPEAQAALDRLLERYTGFATLKKEVIPLDAKRGFFIGLDGRKVPIPGKTESARGHLCMSGYLQNGETLVMRKAAIIWDNNPEIVEMRKEGHRILPVDLVHDEFQTETPNDMKIAIRVAEIQAEAIKQAGIEFNLKCELAGSFYNDDHEDYTIGKTWYQTH